jgi:hypothetical protein
VLRAVQPWQNLSEELVTTANWALDDFKQSADPIYVRIARQCIDHSYEKGTVRPELASYRDGIRDIIGTMEAEIAKIIAVTGSSDVADTLRSYVERHPDDSRVRRLMPRPDPALEQMTLELKLLEQHREGSARSTAAAEDPEVLRPWIVRLDRQLTDVVDRLDRLATLVQDNVKPANDRGRGDHLDQGHPEFEGGRQFGAAWGLARLMILQSDPSREPSDRAIATQLSHTGDLLYLCGMYKFGPQNADSVLAYRARLQAEQGSSTGTPQTPTRMEDEAERADLPVSGTPSGNSAEQQA